MIYMYIWMILKWNVSKIFLDFYPQIIFRFKIYFGLVIKWESQLLCKCITKLALTIYPSRWVKKKHHQSSGIWRSVSSHSKSETLRAKSSCCLTSSQQLPGKVNNEIQLLTVISYCRVFISISLYLFIKRHSCNREYQTDLLIVNCVNLHNLNEPMILLQLLVCLHI